MPIDTSVALIALADAKSYLKVTSSADDGIIGDFVNQASVFATTYCGRKFLEATYTEFYDGPDGDALVLRNYPVTSITNLWDDINRVFPTTSIIDPAQYFLDGESGIIRLFYRLRGFVKGLGNIKVTYVAGYPLAGIPYDLQFAIRKMIAHQYNLGYSKKLTGKQTETISDRQTTVEGDVWPRDCIDILNRYVKTGYDTQKGFS